MHQLYFSLVLCNGTDENRESRSSDHDREAALYGVEPSEQPHRTVSTVLRFTTDGSNRPRRELEHVSVRVYPS